MLKLTIQYMASMNYFLVLSNNMNTARIRSVGRTPLFQRKTIENIRYKNYSTQYLGAAQNTSSKLWV
jgi:hypothetical protein